MQLFGSAVDTAICRAQNTRGMRRAKALQNERLYLFGIF
jgi:hypothetical protein